MAFALSIKTKIDFPETGPIFLVLTLIIISFTTLYSSVLLDFILKKCEIINLCEADNFEESGFRHKNCFEVFKSKIEEINNHFLLPCVIRDNKLDLTVSNNVNSRINVELQDGKSESLDNFEKQIHVKSESAKNSKSKTFFEKRNSVDVTLDKRNFQIKNMHLFE